MRHADTLGLLVLAGGIPRCLAADASLPRGVGPEFVKFFSDPQTFTCISNPSISLSASQVNDDYCDCPDGSDEPGTSACAYISALSPHTPPHPNSSLSDSTPGAVLALPGFYCANKHHNPSYVPFTHINDGVCDYEVCCDGSDEWARVGGVQCPDKCKEIGKEWRKLDSAKRASLDAATKKRRELVAAAAVKKKEIENAIDVLTTEIGASEIKVKQLEEEKEEIARKEANRVVQGGGAGKAGILAGLAKGRLRELKGALDKIRNQRDAYVARVSELEEILSTFKVEYNPNFNDEGVKRAVRAWDDYHARDKQHVYDEDSKDEEDVDGMISDEGGSDGIDWEDFEKEEVAPTQADDVAALYDLTSYIPPTLRTWLETQLSSLRDLLITNGILAPRPSTSSTSSESRAVREADDRLTSARNDLNQKTNKKRDHEQDLHKNHGPEDVFRTMKGTCTPFEMGEYIYELCWMDRVNQKSKKGGGAQNMGEFDAFSTAMVDEELPPDGKGLGAGERMVMTFKDGSHCWNGPDRSTTVFLACAEREEVWRVSEEEKCVYRMEVGTPAVCEDDKVGTERREEEKKVGERDEL